jgi:hypothetical protein
MIAGIIFLMAFFALGALLLLITHQALIADNASCVAEPRETPTIRDESRQDQPHDHAA